MGGNGRHREIIDSPRRINKTVDSGHKDGTLRIWHATDGICESRTGVIGVLFIKHGLPRAIFDAGCAFQSKGRKEKVIDKYYQLLIKAILLAKKSV